tara:strand:+ start:535 stop:1302 length:768 start_codon:yes stop_codon:yes gene_type:complete
MIVCKLQGGLGNQLFQYASAISIAKHNLVDVEFVWESLQTNNQWPLTLDKFPNVDLKMFNSFYNGFHTISDNFKYKKIVTQDKNLFLNGYWQSEKYFKEYREEILELFRPTTDTLSECCDVFDSNLKYTSVHIRRGDYLNLPDYHPTCTMEYYNKAFEVLKDKTDKFIIFSDDIKWCKKTFIGEEFTFSENRKDVDDLYLMSLCDNHIIANSSFSWWGAWLNVNVDKVVIAPTKWFGEQLKSNTGDIIPKGWIKI